MNSTNDPPPPAVDKGKRRAEEPTERTPLLGSNSSTPADEEPPPAAVRRRLISKLTRVFLLSLLACIVLCAGFVLLAWSYASRASHVSGDDILDEGMTLLGPDRVDVLNVSLSGGLWVRVEGRMGFDAGSVIGVNPSPDDDNILRAWWKAIGRWGVGRLDRVSVNMSTISIVSQRDPSLVLATIDSPPVVVPLTTDPPPDMTWLTRVALPLFIRPSLNASALVDFLRQSWKDGTVAVRADVGAVDVHGGALQESSWRSILQKQLSNLETSLTIPIPALPGLPHPGNPLSLSELITLQSFSVSSSPQTLDLTACATVIDPAPMTFNMTSPSLPFIISLPAAEPAPIASVQTAPFTLTHPNITLSISGTVLPISAESTPLLSSFLTRYLSGLPNPIVASTGLIPGLTFDLDFPAPNPRPQILRDVTIHDMSIKPGSPAFTASGTVYAKIVLPKGMDVGLHVSKVLPDVFVFDGEVPDDVNLTLPDPLPEHAFGRIRPEDWLPAQSGPVPPADGEGAAFAVTAKIVDVPLEVLPGRQKEFSNFVSKVIFGSGGAVAGLLGSAAVGVEVSGLPFPGDRGMELDGLPFRGSVPVGKKSFLLPESAISD